MMVKHWYRLPRAAVECQSTEVLCSWLDKSLTKLSLPILRKNFDQVISRGLFQPKLLRDST